MSATVHSINGSTTRSATTKSDTAKVALHAYEKALNEMKAGDKKAFATAQRLQKAATKVAGKAAVEAVSAAHVTKVHAQEQAQKDLGKLLASTTVAVAKKVKKNMEARGEAVPEAVKAAAKPAPKAKAAPKAPAVDPDTIEVKRDQLVHLLTKENPKKGKRAARFALYTNGMTVAEYVKAGGKLRDVRWDVAHGFISVK